jgi:hypothetical protein
VTGGRPLRGSPKLPTAVHDTADVHDTAKSWLGE